MSPCASCHVCGQQTTGNKHTIFDTSPTIKISMVEDLQHSVTARGDQTQQRAPDGHEAMSTMHNNSNTSHHKHTQHTQNTIHSQQIVHNYTSPNYPIHEQQLCTYQWTHPTHHTQPFSHSTQQTYTTHRHT